MNHNPFITLNDETEITYSDIKVNNKGEEYVSLYFETPTEKGFSSMEINFPNNNITKLQGYSDKQIEKLMYHYNKIGALAFEFAKEKER